MRLRQIMDTLDLNGSPRCVLVVEDYIPLLDAIVEKLRECGHTVDGFTGLKHRVRCSVIGIRADSQEVPVDLCVYEAAFLDHYFLGGELTGSDAAAMLRNCGSARILAMSSDEAANERMRLVGAHLTLCKPVVRSAFGA